MHKRKFAQVMKSNDEQSEKLSKRKKKVLSIESDTEESEDGGFYTQSKSIQVNFSFKYRSYFR